MKLEKIAKREFMVYDEAEAKDAGIEYCKDWRSAQKGDWILTDDGKVIEVLNRSEYLRKTQKKPEVRIRTGYGVTPTYYGKIMAKRYIVSSAHGSYGEDLKRQVKPSHLQNYFMELLSRIWKPGKLFTTEEIITAYMAAYCENNPNTALVKGKGIVKRHWRTFVSKEFSEILDSQKLTKLEVGKLWKLAVKKVKAEGASAKDLISVIKELSTIHGAYDREKEEKTEGTAIMIVDPGAAKLMKVLSMFQAYLDSGEITIASKDEEILRKAIAEALTQGAEVPQLKGGVDE